MPILKAGIFAAGIVAAMGNAMAQEDQRRFKLIPFTEMTPEQRQYADAVMAGQIDAGEWNERRGYSAAMR